MRSLDIRRLFVDFFTSHDHTRVPSSPLVPDDPTLLLTNAGMNQFKPYYLGDRTPPWRRATSVQKCTRTVDVENVGRTARHVTFFEMLGNFSFGDYYQERAIEYAWRVATEVYQLPENRLWITVYLDDDEAVRIWRRLGVPENRIQRLGKADNYWSMGVPGPAGPSSEINYDRGPAFGESGGPAVNGERYLELWNLVFMQDLRGDGDGKDDFPVLGPLPRRSIDTGLGLDRLAMVLQDVDGICQTDLVAPTLEVVGDVVGRRFPGRDGSDTSVSYQVIADHARCAAFLIADGVVPSNEGRGYVLRRLMRRAVRHARKLGVGELVLPAAMSSVVGNLGETWPELTRSASLIEAIATQEEESFGATLRQGTRLLDAAIARTTSAGGTRLSGETAFELHDTYGFPVDLTVDAAREAGLTVDGDRYAALLDDQRRRAKSSGKGKTSEALRRQEVYRRLAGTVGELDFVGYCSTSAETEVLAILRDGEPVSSASQGQEVEIVLRRSPFYAESGGQVGDTGTIRDSSGNAVDVLDTRYGVDGFRVHTGRIASGEVHSGQSVEAVIDISRRSATARSHSATHVLHATLRRVLGDHARQQGSLVAPDRLRFDFPHFTPVEPEALETIGQLVNDYLLDDPDVRVWHATRAEAEAAGATAFFGEKYGDRVRIVDIGDASRELCGGTHVGHGAQAGPIRILGESSIGSGVRRIEALTGRDALRFGDTERRVLREVSALLGTRPENAMATLRKRLAALAEAEDSLRRHRQRELDALALSLSRQARTVGSGWLVVARVDELSASELRPVATSVLAYGGDKPAAVVLATSSGDKAQLVAAINDTLLHRGQPARTLLVSAAKLIGGGAGGGSGPLANAGGRDVTRLDEALRHAESVAVDLLGA
ncbi:alanine--tRNA ligase [Fodinicola acaciae]|uniref:alanine--tRNA ligase n=1 Tax=Fodinicola acaciae TaxID=2681555 RepID=UPI0013D0CA74|nr:alanine--tRNA ligase [Fodinicola acaciae]